LACRNPLDIDCVETGNTNVVTIAGNVQPDIFENDDSPLELTQSNQTIEISVTQSRNFHTATDKDWTRILIESGVRELDIRTTSSLESVDTQLTLFDSDGEIIGCALNTPGIVTLNARLRLPNLQAGEYFLRIEQQDDVGIPGPVDNYALTTTISINNSGNPIEFGDCSRAEGFPEKPSSKRPIVSPIINLLLD